MAKMFRDHHKRQLEEHLKLPLTQMHAEGDDEYTMRMSEYRTLLCRKIDDIDLIQYAEKVRDIQAWGCFP